MTFSIGERFFLMTIGSVHLHFGSTFTDVHQALAEILGPQEHAHKVSQMVAAFVLDSWNRNAVVSS